MVAGAALLAACEQNPRAEDALAVGLGNPELRHPIAFSASTEVARRRGARRRRGSEPEPAGRRLPLPLPLQARGQRAADHRCTGRPARSGVDCAFAEGYPAQGRGSRHRLPRPSRRAPEAARTCRHPPRLSPSGGRAAGVRQVGRERRPQRGAHSLSQLRLRHPAQPRHHGRQRARSAASRRRRIRARASGAA